MGWLHEGHLTLVRTALTENDCVAVSLFVNPTQFNNPEDLAAYPRDEKRDRELLEALGTHLLYAPGATAVYRPGHLTSVRVADLTEVLEGGYRPGHFAGVTTIVAKLFALFAPDRAYFGAKDAQQARVIEQLNSDLDFGIEIRVLPTVREDDGLAMSSRNVRLAEAQRPMARLLYGALSAARASIARGGADAESVRAAMRMVLGKGEGVRVDYVSVADPRTLKELDGVINRPVLVSLAAYVGDVRLIDNLTVEPPGAP